MLLERNVEAPPQADAMLRAAEACFARDGALLAGPFSATLPSGKSLAYGARNAQEARIVARMAAGIVKPTTGSISIGEYNPRVQPVQAKRLVAFAFGGDAGVVRSNFDRAVSLHAALWGIDAASAHAHANLIRSVLGDEDDALALAVALAHAPPLVVLELPRAALIAPLRRALPNAAIFWTTITETHADFSP
ncbi:MAG TPA: hypothetical protein VME66_00290 [Candidatus Acidoferrales bacterium]|nr:hypothetical protein [Candidatus Acidoferrales bacterium]